jgi:PIN domain nuclease of toxin-antitoxin system
MSPGFVLDASAILALLGEEPGHLVVQEALPFSVISAVNLSEVITKIAAQGVRKEVALQMLSLLGVEVVPFEEADAWTIGFLYPDTKHLGLSLGDRACIGLGLRLKRIILTADRIWRDIALPVEIRLIR